MGWDGPSAAPQPCGLTQPGKELGEGGGASSPSQRALGSLHSECCAELSTVSPAAAGNSALAPGAVAGPAEPVLHVGLAGAGRVSLLFHSLPSPLHVSSRKCRFSRHCMPQQPASCLAEANSQFKSLLISLQTMCSDF